MAQKLKYLTYIEETPKHFGILADIGERSAQTAIAESHEMGVSVTYLDGEEIVTVTASGERIHVATLQNHRRKVLLGAKTTLSKK